MSEITEKRLKELLHYNPETGIFTWTNTTNRSIKTGSSAGWIDDGYIRIKIDGKTYQAHRLAHLYMKGRSPEELMDHKNEIRDDNRWCNLREAASFQNQRNSGKQSNNTSGFKGVTRNGKNWRAQATIEGKRTHLGTFPTPQEAHEAYKELVKTYHGEFANFG